MTRPRGPRALAAQHAGLVAFGSGLVFAAAAPPIDFTPGILVGLVGLAIALDDAPSARRGWLFGFGANLVALRFVPDVIARFTPLPLVAGYLALVLVAMAQAIPWALAGAVARVIRSETEGLPRFVAFAIAVFSALFVPAVFPWTPAGGLATAPALLQTAATIGERGTSFVIALGCGMVARGVVAPAARLVACGSAVFGVLAAHGALRMRDVEAERAAAARAKVALVAPDFDAFDRWNEARASMMLERLTALTKNAERRGAELTVWPESAYPYTLPHGTRRSPPGARAVLQPGVRGPVLTGAYMAGGDGVGYNSAILATADGALSRSYDKRHLLWFGETVPLADQLPFVRRVFARGTGLAPGSESVLFETGGIRAAVLNCYEDTLPFAGREAMALSPNVLVNITNDAWFAESAEGELHLRLAVLRAIETRRDLLRAVNRGPTTWISASGRVLARREGAAGTGPPPPLVVDAALLDEAESPYARVADTPLLTIVAVTLSIAWWRVKRRERRSEERRPRSP